MARWCAALALVALAACPALAQTDDRISNDAIQLLAADAVVGEIGTLCVADTGNDPSMIGAMDGWRERNRAWQIVAVTTLGARGATYTADTITHAREEFRARMIVNYNAATDRAAWCLRMANDIESAGMSAGSMFPDAAKRVEEAGKGKWPVLDVADSVEVWSAYRVRERFHQIEYLMERCAEGFGDPRRFYSDAYPYWRSRNLAVLDSAEAVIEGWGALDPSRSTDAREFAELDVDILFYDVGAARERCEAFIAGLEAGTEDITATDGALVENVTRYAANIPGSE